MADVLILMLVFSYCAFLIVRLVRKKKAARVSGCGCTGCCAGCSGCSQKHWNEIFQQVEKESKE